MKLRILFAGLIFGVALLAADSGAELFQKALTQEQAAGNLPEAIKLYQQVAKDYASDRALAAKALIQAARCYEKLGEGQAQKLYEQIAREFSDQREYADTARARLAVLRQQSTPVTMTARRLDTNIPGFIAGDGRRAFLRDGNSLVVADALGNNRRTIRTFKSEFNGVGVGVSRDLTLVVIAETPTTGPTSLAVMKSDGTGYRELGQVGRGTSFFVSWDNRYVFLSEPQKDGSSSIIRVSLADGRRQEVVRREKPVDIVGDSPDSRFIAFGERAIGTNRILVVPSTGGEPVVVAENAGLLDWTRDGRYLAVNSGRANARALNLLPMRDGRAAGEPVFIRNGAIESGGILASGALVYWSLSPPGGRVISIGTLAADGHVEGWKPLDLDTGLIVDPRLDLSPDGRQITYFAGSLDSNQEITTLRVHDLVTGADRSLYSDARIFSTCHWASRKPKIFCAMGSGVTTDVMEIAPETGVAEKLGVIASLWILHAVSPDDSELYGYAFPNGGLQRWSFETHETSSMGEGINPSPDGKWIWRGGRPAEPQSDPAMQLMLEIRPSESTEWRRVGYFRMQPWRGPGNVHVTFSPDGAWLYFHARDEAGKDSLFRVPTAGGEAVRLGDLPSRAIEGTMKLSRDGRQIILVAPDAAVRRNETWLLENFEPKQTAAK